MRLEITLDKEIIKNKFNIDTKYDVLRSRINRHTLIVSEELKDIWDKDADENNYRFDYNEWLMSIVREKTKIRKVKLIELEGSCSNLPKDKEIGIKTAMASEDKLLVGDYTNVIKNIHNKVKFVSDDIFMKEDKQTIKLNDIESVIQRNKIDELFSIYETPIRIEVTYGNAEILAKYLSKFYSTTNNLIIKDKYLSNPENERNLKKYVLKYINKDNCKIKFITYWDKKTKGYIDKKFKNYEGFNSEVVLSKKDMAHNSYIETDEYIIDLGYRLKVFGGVENDGETEYEIVNITKK